MKDNPFVTNNKNKIRLSFLISGLALVLMLAFSGTLFLSNKNAQAAVSYWTNSSYRASRRNRNFFKPLQNYQWKRIGTYGISRKQD